jgi:hypothetical protein
MEDLERRLLRHAQSLRELLEEKTEIAGCVEYPIDRKYQVGGTTSNVNVPDCKFTYHTHPRVAYVENDVDMAWPSGEDVAAMAGDPVGYGHAVITLEGVYIMTLTPNAKKKLRSMSDSARNEVADVLQSIFSSTHDFRKRSLSSPEEFVNWANGFTMSAVDGGTRSSIPKICSLRSCPQRNVPTPYKDEEWPIDKWMKSQGMSLEKFKRAETAIGRQEKVLNMKFISWNKIK